jgi:hypothetical protein
LEREALKARPEVNENKTKYMGVIKNIPNLRQELNVDSQAFEARMLKYLGALITGKNEIAEEIKVRTAAGNQCCYGLKHIFTSRTVGKISKIKIYETILKPVVMYGCETQSMIEKDKFVQYMGVENSDKGNCN